MSSCEGVLVTGELSWDTELRHWACVIRERLKKFRVSVLRAPKTRQLVIRKDGNTDKHYRDSFCTHKHGERRKKISQGWLTKMRCNIDDGNKAPHNKPRSYRERFLFNNESPSASGVNTACVRCLCVCMCEGERKKTSILNENKTSIFNLRREQAGMQSQRLNGEGELRLYVACKSHPDRPAAASSSATSFLIDRILFWKNV